MRLTPSPACGPRFLNEAGKSRFLTDMQEAGLTPLGPARGGSESLRDSLGTEG